MGITRDIGSELAVALRAAHHIGARMARMHVDDLWGAKRDPDQARWILHRLSAERRRALSDVMLTLNASWWEAATVDDIARAYRLARTWGCDDGEFVRLEGWIVASVRRRYGVGLDTRPERPSGHTPRRAHPGPAPDDVSSAAEALTSAA